MGDGFGDAVKSGLQKLCALPLVPKQIFAAAAGQAPIAAMIHQGTEVGLVAKAPVRQDAAGILKGGPGLQMGADAIALLSPLLGRNRLAGFEQTPPQVGFCRRRITRQRRLSN